MKMLGIAWRNSNILKPLAEKIKTIGVEEDMKFVHLLVYRYKVWAFGQNGTDFD